LLLISLAVHNTHGELEAGEVLDIFVGLVDDFGKVLAVNLKEWREYGAK
jgi:hypothetical protein